MRAGRRFTSKAGGARPAAGDQYCQEVDQEARPQDARVGSVDPDVAVGQTQPQEARAHPAVRLSETEPQDARPHDARV